jgi:trehalose-6-phosphatase
VRSRAVQNQSEDFILFQGFSMDAELDSAVCGLEATLERTTSCSSSAKALPKTSPAGTLPSALDYINKLLEHGRGIAFLLDYDGTLTPIVEDPDGAVLPEHVRNLLRELSRQYPVAIVTGRSREKILRLVRIAEIYYAGSHGFDIEIPALRRATENNTDLETHEILTVPNDSLKSSPDELHIRFHIAAEVAPILQRAAQHLRSVFGLEEKIDLSSSELRSRQTHILESSSDAKASARIPDGICVNEASFAASNMPLSIQPEPASPPMVDSSFLNQIDQLLSRKYTFHGLTIEDNHLSVSVHYRRCDPAHVPTIERIVDSVAYRYGLKKTRGKCVFELRPAVKWDKGRAAKWLLEMIETREGNCYLPVYIGDDVTDEDAMKFVSSHGGIGVIVTEDDSRETFARLRLREPAEVASFLQSFLKS